MIDLHVHSTCSDGQLAPRELALRARRLNLSALALTDHDTAEGCPALIEACEAEGIRGIAGVEISVDHGPGAFHLLGYFIDPAHGPLRSTLRWICAEREERNRKILKALRRLGLEMSMADVLAEVCAGNVNVGRPHVAMAMVRKGYVADVGEAFGRYLAKGKPAYAARGKLGPEDAIRLVREAGGIPVLAHPYTLEESGAPALEGLVRCWANAGLQGIECHYPEHGPARTRRYLDLARRHDLLPTGGTDSHGAARPGVELGIGDGSFRVPDSVLEGLVRLRPAGGRPNAGGSAGDRRPSRGRDCADDSALG